MSTPVVILAILTFAACASANSRLGSGDASPCGPSSCDGLGAQLNVVYRYKLTTHCGVLETRFDGRVFYVEALYPTDLPAGLDEPVDTGTMTLLSIHRAVFKDPSGHVISFVDSPPGAIGNAYPFTVHLLAGGNQLIDERFAGRVWHPQGTLPGMSGPPYGNGHDANTRVTGTFTLVSADQAVFLAKDGSTVAFARVPAVGCD